MKTKGTSIGYLILGLFLGGLISATFGASAEELPYQVRVLISIIGPFIGLGVGYIISMVVKQEEIESHKRQVELQQTLRPPTQIVGQFCSDCSSKIIFVNNGDFCPQCLMPFCSNCLSNHQGCDPVNVHTE